MKNLLFCSVLLLTLNPIAAHAHHYGRKDTSFSRPKPFICDPELQRNNRNYLARMNCAVKFRVLDSNRKLEEVDRNSRLIYGTPTQEDIRYYNRQQFNSDCFVRNGRLFCAR